MLIGWLLLIQLSTTGKPSVFQSHSRQDAAMAQMAPSQVPLPILGGDVTEILRVERTGGAYRWQGKKVEIFKAMKAAGWTAVRLRLWVHPTEPWCSTDYDIELAKRAQAAGLKVILDFHYSDTWADPQHQITPAAWQGESLSELAKSVETYTKETVLQFEKAGVPVYAAEIGNEIRVGMLWPVGKLSGDNPEQWLNLTTLIKAGMEGLDEASPTRKIIKIIHIDTGGDNAMSQLFCTRLKQYGVDFDVLGLSYYPWWHGSLEGMVSNINELAQHYPYKILIAETAWPWTKPSPGQTGSLFGDEKNLIPEFPPTPQGQAKMLKQVTEDVSRCGNGWGVLYWAPTWIETPTWKNNWWNLTEVDQDGNLLPGFWVWK